MIDSKYLKLILTIDRCGSLNQASKELNLTQSALSHQLKKLEEYLEIKIFHRVGNQLFFTEAGNALKEKGSLIVQDLEALEYRIKEIKESQAQRYIHGYSQREAQRLIDQATSVEEFLHYDSIWGEGSRILEIGCGVGAQTQIIAQRNPNTEITSIDISEKSLAIAKASIDDLGIKNVIFKKQDVRDLKSSKDGFFDHVFICFVLEHLNQPLAALNAAKRVIKPGGTITVIEGDHGSTFFYPENKHAQNLVHAQVRLQQEKGGNANIGRQLYPLLTKAGYANIEVSPRQIYVDHSKGQLVDGFIKNTFTAMIQGMAEEILAEGITSIGAYEKGIEGLLRTTANDGVFSYTFFKARGEV